MSLSRRPVGSNRPPNILSPRRGVLPPCRCLRLKTLFIFWVAEMLDVSSVGRKSAVLWIYVTWIRRPTI